MIYWDLIGWVFIIIEWMCTHTANKHHVKVNLASDDPFKPKYNHLVRIILTRILLDR